MVGNTEVIPRQKLCLRRNGSIKSCGYFLRGSRE